MISCKIYLGDDSMRMVDLIELKKDNKEFDEKQLHFIVDGYVRGIIPDYQISALLMAICFNGLSAKETAYLTKEMEYSGDIIDLSSIEGIKVDKHSTGGVGDKTSLVLGPIVASLGAKVAKMSGRGLGHTGGTLDKLESIPGLSVYKTKEEFIKQVNDVGLAIIGQTESLVPADKKLYALRDVTATVSCIPLIASSIMSKKLASGADTILLDVKYGKGAVMQTKEEAIQLANLMIEIGKHCQKDTRATISNMNQPLGNAIGNCLEVIEAIETLQGKGPHDLEELCLQAGSTMLVQAHIYNNENEAYQALKDVLVNGQALEKLKEMVEAQGGDVSYIENPDKFEKARVMIELPSLKTGYVKSLEAKTLGIVAMKLGGGRMTKDEDIDHHVGLLLHKKIGDYIVAGESLLQIHASDEVSDELINDLYQAYEIVDEFVEKPVLIEEILK